MDPKIAQALIEDTAALLQKTAELQDYNAQLVKQASDSQQEAARLNQLIQQSRTRVKQAAQQAADHLVERGVLSHDKVAQFVELITNDPAQGIAAMEKVASESAAQQLGSPSEQKTAGAGLDPLAAFAMR